MNDTTASEIPRPTALLAAERASLAALIAKNTPAVGMFTTRIDGLTLWRRIAPTAPVSRVYPTSLGVIAQGLKRITVGDRTYACDARNYVLTALDIPTHAQIVEASEEMPYLALQLALEPRDIARLLADTELPGPPPIPAGPGLAVSELPLALVNALCRLLALLDTPQDIPALEPLVRREILYRLLVGGHGQRLRQMGRAGSRGHQIDKAIRWVKDNYALPLNVEALAARVPMASSTFNQQFRAITSLSPLQYQKRLRLHEARRLMLSEQMDAATAAHRVGYESPSQFSREYGRLFGNPPRRDISRLIEDLGAF